MLNFKQEELIENLVTDIHARFPEAIFIGVSESPEDPDSLWIRVTAPEDEDRELELIEYAADKSMDILLDYGYHMLITPTRN